MLLVACAGETRAQQLKKSQDWITDINLYEICKSDLDKNNFELTPCGMYVQSALSSYKTSEYIIASYSVQNDGNESINKFAKLISECNETDFYIKKVAADYVDHVHKNISNIDPASANAGNYFWYYFLSCGHIDKIKL